MKLHIGCGTVYLDGYVNVHPEPHGMACLHPKAVERNRTTIDEYYKDDWENRPTFEVADVASTLIELPDVLAGKGAPVEDIADEICMFHVLEHIQKYELDLSMKTIVRLLKPDGAFRVAVPDIDAFTIQFAGELKKGEITEEEKEWYYRYLYGTQKDMWSHHYCGYNKARLIKLLKEYGFNRFEKLQNQNFYPAVHLLAYL